MKRPGRGDVGLKRSDQKDAVDVPCSHPAWNAVNATTGCIHPDHGPLPFLLVCHFTGLRMVDGVPTRYVPAKAS